MFLRRSVLILIFLAILSALPVSAHGYLIRSIPEDRSSLERPPARLQYWFSEGLEPDFSQIILRDDRANILAEGGVDSQDNTLLTLQVPQDLPDGAYIVELRPAFASDAHVVIESRVFFVGAVVDGIESQAASTNAEIFEVIWKALLFNASSLLFGLTMLYSFVLVPVWGNEAYPQGLLPPRIMQRLNLLMWGSLFLAAYANVMGLLQQATTFFGTSLELVIEGGLWEVVRIGSRFGDVWNFRMLVLLVVFGLHSAGVYYSKQYPKVVRSFWTANTYLLALMLGAQAVSSHAAGSLIWTWAAIFMHWLHVLAVTFWVGGIIALVFILPVALKPYEGESRWQALQPLMRRFSRYVVVAVVLVITTGIYNAANWFYSPSDLLSSYGASLSYKLAMMALLLFVGALHHLALRPQLLDSLPLENLRNWASKFGLSMRIESVLAIVTLLFAALLSATPIPKPDVLNQDIVSPSQNQRLGEYEIQMSLSPAAPSINSVDITVRRNVLLVDDIQVYVQFVLPSLDKRTSVLQADEVDLGLYTLVTDKIEQEGAWLALVDIVDSDGQVTRLVYSWEISEDAGLITSLPPSWFNILSLLMVLAALAYAIYPSGRKLATKMNWSKTNIVIVLGVSLMTIITLLASASVLNYQSEQARLQENPPPKIVNAVVPDMGSIAIGGALLQNTCRWETLPDYADLLNRIDTLRDEELYTYVQQGWRGLAACESSETQAWHLVNYLRSLEERP